MTQVDPRILSAFGCLTLKRNRKGHIERISGGPPTPKASSPAFALGPFCLFFGRYELALKNNLRELRALRLGVFFTRWPGRWELSEWPLELFQEFALVRVCFLGSPMAHP